MIPLNPAHAQLGAGEPASPVVDERGPGPVGSDRPPSTLTHVVSQPRERDVGEGSPSIDVREIRVGHRAVLAVSGELELATADTLREALESAIASGASELWVDLAHVRFLDSAGVRVLLGAQTLLRGRSKSLAVICPPGPVRRVFEVSGLEALARDLSRSRGRARGRLSTSSQTSRSDELKY